MAERWSSFYQALNPGHGRKLVKQNNGKTQYVNTIQAYHLKLSQRRIRQTFQTSKMLQATEAMPQRAQTLRVERRHTKEACLPHSLTGYLITWSTLFVWLANPERSSGSVIRLRVCWASIWFACDIEQRRMGVGISAVSPWASSVRTEAIREVL